MLRPTFDADGSPSADTLDAIEQWRHDDPNGCLEFVKAAWRDRGRADHDLTAGEAAVVRATTGERFLRLATGGWSGNEALLFALDHNVLVTLVTWRLSAAGGLHIYRYRTS